MRLHSVFGLSVSLIAALASAAGASPKKARTRSACSGAPKHCNALIVLGDDGKPLDLRVHADVTADADGPYRAADLQAAYGIDPTIDPHATVAVVDAFGYANLESDLGTYRSMMGLPPCTVASGCLTILNQSGQTSPLPAEDQSQDGQGWVAETALDVDMASAGCPLCKLIVVEADNDQGDGLEICNDAAAAAGATVVSNSWGTNEAAIQLPVDDNHFAHTGIAYFASSGDQGAGASTEGFPAGSLHVIGVGGTSLTRSASSPRGFDEAAWSDAGSLCSKVFDKPAWQTDGSCGKREVSDVSAVADPDTGVIVAVDGQLFVLGGTSAASPLTAAIFALTNHKDVTSEFVYENATRFNDVTTGTNGPCTNSICVAGVGWDGPTGVGTPIAPLLNGGKLPTFAESPPDQAQVPPGFTVSVSCTPTDSATVTEVDIGIDGDELAEITTPPFSHKMPASLPNGPHVVFARCKMSSLVVTGTVANVQQVAPCSADSDCSTTGDLCFDGACIPGPSLTSGLGSTCATDADCASAMCGPDKTCVTPCDSTNACPTQFSCDTSSMLCSKGGGGDGGGGCDTTGDGSPAPIGLGIGLGLTLLALTRKRS